MFLPQSVRINFTAKLAKKTHSAQSKKNNNAGFVTFVKTFVSFVVK